MRPRPTTLSPYPEEDEEEASSASSSVFTNPNNNNNNGGGFHHHHQMDAPAGHNNDDDDEDEDDALLFESSNNHHNHNQTPPPATNDVRGAVVEKKKEHTGVATNSATNVLYKSYVHHNHTSNLMEEGNSRSSGDNHNGHDGETNDIEMSIKDQNDDNYDEEEEEDDEMAQLMASPLSIGILDAGNRMGSNHSKASSVHSATSSASVRSHKSNLDLAMELMKDFGTDSESDMDFTYNHEEKKDPEGQYLKKEEEEEEEEESIVYYPKGPVHHNVGDRDQDREASTEASVEVDHEEDNNDNEDEDDSEQDTLPPTTAALSPSGRGKFQPPPKLLPWYVVPGLICAVVSCLVVILVIVVVAVVVSNNNNNKKNDNSSTAASNNGDIPGGNSNASILLGSPTCAEASKIDFSLVSAPSVTVWGDTRLGGPLPDSLRSLAGSSSSDESSSCRHLSSSNNNYTVGRGLFFQLSQPTHESGKLNVTLCPQQPVAAAAGMAGLLLQVTVLTGGTCNPNDQDFEIHNSSSGNDQNNNTAATTNVQCIATQTITANGCTSKGSDQDGNTTTNNNNNVVSWYAQAGQLYYLYVQELLPTNDDETSANATASNNTTTTNESEEEEAEPRDGVVFQMTLFRSWAPAMIMDIPGTTVNGTFGMSVATTQDGFLVVASAAAAGSGKVRFFRRQQPQQDNNNNNNNETSTTTTTTTITGSNSLLSYQEDQAAVNGLATTSRQERYGFNIDVSNTGNTVAITSASAVHILGLTTTNVQDLQQGLVFDTELWYEVNSDDTAGSVAVSGNGNTVAWNLVTSGTVQVVRRTILNNGTDGSAAAVVQWLPLGPNITSSTPPPSGNIYDKAVALSDNGNRLLVAGANHTARVYALTESVNSTTGQVEFGWTLRAGHVLTDVTSVAMTSTGSCVAAGLGGDISSKSSSSSNSSSDNSSSTAINDNMVKVYCYIRNSNSNNGQEERVVQAGQTLRASDNDRGNTTTIPVSNFGHSVSLSANGDFLVVGAPWYTPSSDRTDTGKVFLYRFNYQTLLWELEGELWTNVTADLFGWSAVVSSDGSTVVAGAPWHEGGGKENSGMVRIAKWLT
ncbi:hypothetical protein ACA910_011559 [Epithemia clementina (nom. ined.)]